jgi:hypothetical protein
MTLVVCRVRRSVNAAFTLYRDKLDVSLKSVYNKLNASDPSVCAGLVLHAAGQMRRVMEELNVPPRPLIPGYRTRIVDGNQFAATEHRIKELRTIAGGPLPGKALVVFDADWGIISDVYCSADSYTQERQMVLDLLGDVQAGELWIADRNFCTATSAPQHPRPPRRCGRSRRVELSSSVGATRRTSAFTPPDRSDASA